MYLYFVICKKKKKIFKNLPARTMSANLTVFAFVDIAKNKCPNFTKHRVQLCV